MDKYKHLVLIDGKDRTESVKSLHYEDNKCFVQFNDPSTEYVYNSRKVKAYEVRSSIDQNSVKIFHQDKPIVGFESILDFGDYIRAIGKKGFEKLFNKREVRFEYNALTNFHTQECVSYFRRIADIISLEVKDGTKILSEQYKKLTFISKDVVLAAYWDIAKKIQKREYYQHAIYPFGLNQSQKVAIKNAFTSQVSIIEGPPGTGKTQTILNIISNAVWQGKSIAVVSFNNSATENVLEKLDKYGLSFLAAFLGSDITKNKFISDQTGEYPDMSTWGLSRDQRQMLCESVFSLSREMDDMMISQNRIAQIDQEIADINCERLYFKDYQQNEEMGYLRKKLAERLSHRKLLSLLLECEQLAENQAPIGWWMRFRYIVLYGIGNSAFFKQPPDTLIPTLQGLYYDIRLRELGAEKSLLVKKLAGYHFDEKCKLLTERSMSLFKDELAERFSGEAKRKKFTKENLRENAAEVNQEYPLILSTTYSIRSSLNQDHKFDYIVIDEASQVDIVTGALALSCAENAVIVGDLMQLSNVVTRNEKKETEEIWNEFNLNAAYNYATHSLLSSAVALWKDAPRSLLREHYRCHPRIIGFCNRKFYRGQLIVLTKDHSESDVLKVYKTVPGNHARGHLNQRQIEVIKDEVIPQLGSVRMDSIGIVSPYRCQADKTCKQIVGDGLEIDTVHKFQGREKDTIILATVDNAIGEFVDSPNLPMSPYPVLCPACAWSCRIAKKIRTRT